MGQHEVSTKILNAEFDIGVAMYRRRWNLTFAEALKEIGASYRLTADECAIITKREIAKNKAFERQLQLEAHFSRLQA